MADDVAPLSKSESVSEGWCCQCHHITLHLERSALPAFISSHETKSEFSTLLSIHLHASFSSGWSSSIVEAPALPRKITSGAETVVMVTVYVAVAVLSVTVYSTGSEKSVGVPSRGNITASSLYVIVGTIFVTSTSAGSDAVMVCSASLMLAL